MTLGKNRAEFQFFLPPIIFKTASKPDLNNTIFLRKSQQQLSVIVVKVTSHSFSALKKT